MHTVAFNTDVVLSSHICNLHNTLYALAFLPKFLYFSTDWIRKILHQKYSTIPIQASQDYKRMFWNTSISNVDIFTRRMTLVEMDKCL